MRRMKKYLFAGMTIRLWLITLTAGAMSFGSVTYLVGKAAAPDFDSVRPAHITRLELPPTIPTVTPQVTEVRDLPDLSVDTLKANGVSDAEIMKGLDKLIEEHAAENQPVLSAGKIEGDDTSPSSLTGASSKTPVTAP
jgi:hypothetical protein